MKFVNRIQQATLFAASLALLIGCGSPGAPAPPSLELPIPVQDLSAVRTGNSVRLTWIMPSRTTDRLALKHPISAEVCRSLESGPCTAIGTVSFNPGQPAEYTDHLPPDLVRGTPRLLAYGVDLRNHAQKSAGISKYAITAAGVSPAAITGLTYQVRRDGVLLSWHPVAGGPTESQTSTVFRIGRERMTVGKAANPASTKISPGKIPPANEPPDVTLAVRVPGGADPGHALDTNAQPNQKYRYTVDRVSTLTVAGHSIEVQGQPSDPVIVPTTDVFPPAVPHGLLAVADAAAGAVDLSWRPDSEADLAGYYVYRRDVGTSLPAQRIPAAAVSSSQLPIATPAFRDLEVERGHTYAYSISAIDQSGNESARSPEVVESLPNR
jgi:hypothetical protein